MPDGPPKKRGKPKGAKSKPRLQPHEYKKSVWLDWEDPDILKDLSEMTGPAFVKKYRVSLPTHSNALRRLSQTPATHPLTKHPSFKAEGLLGKISDQSLADLEGVTSQTVRRWRYDRGIKAGHHMKAKERKLRVLQAYETLQHVPEVAKATKLTEETVARILHTAGIPLSREKANARELRLAAALLLRGFGFTLEEVGTLFHISRERVRQLQTQAFEFAKKYEGTWDDMPGLSELGSEEKEAKTHGTKP